MKDIITAKHYNSSTSNRLPSIDPVYIQTTQHLRASIHSKDPSHHHHHQQLQNAIQRPFHNRPARKGPPRQPQRRIPGDLLSPLLHLHLHTLIIPQSLHNIRRLRLLLLPRPQHHQGLESPEEAPPRDERCLLRLLRPRLQSFYRIFRC